MNIATGHHIWRYIEPDFPVSALIQKTRVVGLSHTSHHYCGCFITNLWVNSIIMSNWCVDYTSHFCESCCFFASKISQGYEWVITISVVGRLNLIEVKSAWASCCYSNKFLMICNDSVFNLLLKIFRGFVLDLSSVSCIAYWSWHDYLFKILL